VFSTIGIAVAALAVIVAFAFRVRIPKPGGDMDAYERDEALFARRCLAGAGAGFGVVAVVWTLFTTITIVGANEVGVPVTFGKIGTPLQSGPHLKAPWTGVETLPTRPRTFEVDATVRTRESGTVTIRLSGRWATDRDNASGLYTQVRTGDEDRIQAELIGPNLVSAAGAHYGGLSNFEAVTGQEWEANARGTQDVATKYLAAYGVDVDTVRIRGVKPDEATERNIAAFAAQQRATEVAKEGQKTAAAEAERQRIAAAGLAAAAAQTRNLTPVEVQTLCLQAGERIAINNAAKNLPTYALPCTGPAPVIAK
jgi:regulator of protease activity HflC (stomatin/prohibitin superfamily)